MVSLGINVDRKVWTKYICDKIQEVDRKSMCKWKDVQGMRVLRM